MSVSQKILVVDDDTVNRDFFLVMLSRLGYTVEEAVDGHDALGKLKKFTPDLILMDNIMPNMSGWDLTKNLKNDPKYRDIPVIMLSAIDDVKDKVAGFELGIVDYITKPFNFSEVLARIKAALRNSELFTQISVRESRLRLAEDLCRDMKQILSDLAGSIDNTDIEKTRRQIAELDTRIDKTIHEWEDLKKNEIGLSVLESQIRKHLNQENNQ